ncbi:MAG: 50S ribosomal protein L30 [Acidobacteriota bacterium]
MTVAKTITVCLTRSPIACPRRQKETVRSLGLTRLNQSRTLPDNGAVRGMVSAVSHLVEMVAGKEKGHERKR